MKAKKQIITTQDIDIDITDVTLLSIEEYEDNEDIIPLVDVDNLYWLRSPGSDRYAAACVCDDGSADYYGSIVCIGFNAVRPVMRLSESEISGLSAGDKIEMAGYTWTILHGGLALCDAIVGRTAFRKDWQAEDANVYESSDIKKWLENWATENGIEVQK